MCLEQKADLSFHPWFQIWECCNPFESGDTVDVSSDIVEKRRRHKNECPCGNPGWPEWQTYSRLCVHLKQCCITESAYCGHTLTVPTDGLHSIITRIN